MNCACGLPLHYNDPEVRDMVDRLVENQGEFVTVQMGRNKYKVQRHYIALHGLKGSELDDLAKRGVVERITGRR